jgi:hypothetical protein
VTAPADMERIEAAAVMTDKDIAVRLSELAIALQRRPPVRDWVDAHRAGDVLSSDVAGFICGCSADTICRRADAAAEEGHPLGIKYAGIWMFDLPRLLDWIEYPPGIEAGRGARGGAVQHGRHARLAAESRAKKNADLRSPPQNEPISTTVAAVTAS